jgi:putative spermidine/putrescine transport system permease protein
VIDREFTLKTYGELLRPANLDIIVRTVLMAAAVTLPAALIAFPIAYYMRRATPAGRVKALFYLASCCRCGRATWSASTPGS